MFARRISMKFAGAVLKVEQLMQCTAGEMALLSEQEVIGMCSTWASISVPCKEEFHYRASNRTFNGVELYYIEQSGLVVNANMGSQDISCLINVVDGVVTKKTESAEFVYTPNTGQQTFVFHSEEYAVYRHFNSAIWMLPIVKPKVKKSQKEVGANLIDNFSFSDLVAFSTLPEGPAFASKILNQQECAKIDQRYTGVYSKVLSCLIQRQYSLDQIAYETGLPVSTLSKFRIGNISIMEFVRSYRRERIRERLKHSDHHSVAREEGFSSKYKMLDFLNRDNAYKSSVVE